MKAVKQRPKSSTGNLSLILKRIFFKHNSSGGRSRSIRREPPTMGGLATGKLITCGCKSSAPFLVIYKAGREPMPYW